MEWLIKHPDREAWRTTSGWVDQVDGAMTFRTEMDAQAYIDERGSKGHTVQKTTAPTTNAVANGYALTEYNPWGAR